MAIYNEAYLCEYFNGSDDILIEGVSFKDAAGLGSLTTKLVNFGKSIASKFNKNQYITEENIQREIDNLEDVIADIEDELKEVKDPDYKISAKTVAKYFLAFFTQYTISYIASSLIVVPIGSAGIGVGGLARHMKISNRVEKAKSLKVNAGHEKLVDVVGDAVKDINKKATISDIKTFVKEYAKFSATLGAAVGAIASGISTAAFLADYKKSLLDWKGRLEDMKKGLEKKLKEAKA